MYKKHIMAFEMQIKPQIPADTGDLKVLVGGETEYCGMYDVLGMGKEAALKLDFLLIPHTHVHMTDFVMPAPPAKAMDDAKARVEALLAKVEGISPERAAKWAEKLPIEELKYYMTDEIDLAEQTKFISDFMIQSFKGLMNNETLKSYSDVLPVSVAHPFQPVGYGGLQGAVLERIEDSTFRRIFGKAAALGVGLELNPRCGDPALVRMNAIAKECGCKFTLGSDAHSPDGMPNILKTEDAMAALGLTNDDLMEFLL
jgi:histidinol phosphatase-like PHP family hydrolase